MSPRRKRPSLLPVRIALAAFNFVMDIRAHLPGGRYSRFLRLPYWSTRAFARGDHERAAAHARELLELADAYPGDWNFGNAIHLGHIILGRVALAAGDVSVARTELLAAGLTPGSPQLNAFGPNMSLAKDLLAVGEVQVVREFFDLCRVFWQMGTDQLDQWTADVVDDREPEFGANLDC